MSSSGNWRVYILRCADGTLYTGIAKDLPARLAAHTSGEGSKYTRGRRPVKLAYSESASDRSAAQRREAAIKKLSTADKHALIDSSSFAGRTARLPLTPLPRIR